MFRFSFAVLIVLLSVSLVRADIIIYGGDAIGPDSTWTDGWGGNTANGQNSGWAWHHNAGHPAILYSSDGVSTIAGIRSIVAAAEHTEGNGVNWSKYNWTIDIFTLDGYLSKQQPLTTVNLEAEPDNWNGFIEHDVRWVTPNTEPFGVPGGNAPAGTLSYELIFDLTDFLELSEPLPVGDHIVGLQSRHASSGYGETGMLSSRVGIGPVPYYSSTDADPVIDPTMVIGPLTTDQNFRWGMNLMIDTPTHAVPEPSSLVLMTGALLVGGIMHLRRRVAGTSTS